jgi:hypothetical protein
MKLDNSVFFHPTWRHRGMGESGLPFRNPDQMCVGSGRTNPGLIRTASIDIESGWLLPPAQLSEPVLQFSTVNFSPLAEPRVLDCSSSRDR